MTILKATYTSALVLIFTTACLAAAPTNPSIEWIRQVGSPVQDDYLGVSADALGNIYSAGETNGSLAGAYAGGYDALVTKYSPAGVLIWARQFGTSGDDWARGVSADGSGNVYVTGETNGNLAGSRGGTDAFLTKFDTSGNRLWTRQIGTSSYDQGTGVSADALGNVYICGRTSGNLGGANAGGLDDAFVSKYDANGNLLWARQIGTSASDEALGVSADGLGNVYISGTTEGSLGGPNAGNFASGTADIFTAKYDAAGNQIWLRQFGSSTNDAGFAVDADKLGDVFISGTVGFTGGGTPNAIVGMYDSAGNLVWTQDLGATSLAEYCYGISADGAGNVYAASGSHRLTDSFVVKYTSAGNLLWRQVVGTSGDNLFGASFDGTGNVYISGETVHSLGGPNAGGSDAFLMKIADAPVPEPSTQALATICLLAAALLPLELRRRAS